MCFFTGVSERFRRLCHSFAEARPESGVHPNANRFGDNGEALAVDDPPVQAVQINPGSVVTEEDIEEGEVDGFVVVNEVPDPPAEQVDHDDEIEMTDVPKSRIKLLDPIVACHLTGDVDAEGGTRTRIAVVAPLPSGIDPGAHGTVDVAVSPSRKKISGRSVIAEEFLNGEDIARTFGLDVDEALVHATQDEIDKKFLPDTVDQDAYYHFEIALPKKVEPYFVRADNMRASRFYAGKSPTSGAAYIMILLLVEQPRSRGRAGPIGGAGFQIRNPTDRTRGRRHRQGVLTDNEDDGQPGLVQDDDGGGGDRARMRVD